jgi:uncharacterized membrane protein SirB2
MRELLSVRQHHFLSAASVVVSPWFWGELFCFLIYIAIGEFGLKAQMRLACGDALAQHS